MLGEVAQQQDRRQVMVDRHQHQRGVGPGAALGRQGRRQGGAVEAANEVADAAGHVFRLHDFKGWEPKAP
jgi:hypothetical protein